MDVSALIVVGICFFFAGCFEGIMDFLNFRYKKDHWFWNTKQASVNKWNKKLWIEQGIKKERFPGSSTIFVGFMDGWHLMKWFRNRWIDVAIIHLFAQFSCLWTAISIVLGVRILHGIAFEINYRLFTKFKGDETF